MMIRFMNKLWGLSFLMFLCRRMRYPILWQYFTYLIWINSFEATNKKPFVPQYKCILCMWCVISIVTSNLSDQKNYIYYHFNNLSSYLTLCIAIKSFNVKILWVILYHFLSFSFGEMPVYGSMGSIDYTRCNNKNKQGYRSKAYGFWSYLYTQK